MEYTYKFSTGEEIIEVDDKAYAALKEEDRLERNNAQTYHRHIHSLDAYGFEPEFMAVEDDTFKEELPSSPAYKYAIRHLIPKHQDLLIRRLVHGEQFPRIAQSYNTSTTAIHHLYTHAKERFLHFYSDGLWIYSKENTSCPEAERIRYIPFGLTPSQVQQIRTLRYEHNTLDAIAKQVGVPKNRVKVCLRHNPITKLKCLNCCAAIKQIYAGKLQNFCCKPCYYKWFHKEGMVHNTCPTIKKKRNYMSRQQQIATDFYRQLLIPQKDIAKIIGVSDDYISAHCYVHPLPYTQCLYCGKQVPGVKGKRTEKYCSPACCTDYWNYIKNQKKGQKPKLIIPPVEQVYHAIELRDAGISYKKIQKQSGLSKENIDTLFQFHAK
jgi:hypothetical protein